MTAYCDLLVRVIEDGIAAAEADYPNDADKREGSVAGFEVCRGKSPAELAAILCNAHQRTREARFTHRDDYWRIRCFELEVEWVCNVVSAALMNNGEPTIIDPTARGVMKAAEIFGVKGGA